MQDHLTHEIPAAHLGKEINRHFIAGSLFERFDLGPIPFE